MAVPYGMWAGMGYGPQNMGFMPHNLQYAIPGIPPSSNPLLIDPTGAVRDFAEHACNGDRKQLCTVWDLKCLEDWGKDENHRKVIMEVVKARLDLSWPYNYKALDVLSVMPVSEMLGVIVQLKALAESPNTVEGGAELKKMAKPIYDKAVAEGKKVEEEEMKKKQEAITAMWGGIWANTNQQLKAQGTLGMAGWGGWQYPYQVVPGVPAQAGVEWSSNAPNGWQPYVMAPIPLANYPILGWPRPT